MSTLATTLRRLTRLLPADCQLCGAPASPAAADILCLSCAALLPPPAPHACARCALPLPAPDVHLCGACQTAPPAFDTTRAVFAYAFPLDRLIHLFKYQAKPGLAHYFAHHIAHTLPRPPADALLPMPLHPARQAARGYNQSLELARALACHWQLPILTNAVLRTHNSPPQVSLPHHRRRKNLRRAFQAQQPLDGLRILALDDVLTTGASLHALAAELKRHGAAEVHNLVLARTAPH